MRRKGTYRSTMWHLMVNRVAASVLFNKFRLTIYSYAGMDVEKSAIRDNVFFFSNKVHIGRGVFINRSCYFFNYSPVTIEDACYVAPEVMFCTATHEIGASEKRAGPMYGGPIKVGRGAWIGARAVILPGVTIGAGCIIAAGAVVSADCEPNGLYAGVPARRIKDLP